MKRCFTFLAATMIAAHHAGIKVFATGGIGGVHKGGETTFDISADLHELAATPVTVVCAGSKAILDTAKTLVNTAHFNKRGLFGHDTTPNLNISRVETVC